jgi:hypothetical protein
MEFGDGGKLKQKLVKESRLQRDVRPARRSPSIRTQQSLRPKVLSLLRALSWSACRQWRS